MTEEQKEFIVECLQRERNMSPLVLGSPESELKRIDGQIYELNERKKEIEAVLDRKKKAELLLNGIIEELSSGAQ